MIYDTKFLSDFSFRLLSASDRQPTYNPDTSELSIMLSIATDTCSEGEFRYREPYRELYAVLLEASGLYRLLTGDD